MKSQVQEIALIRPIIIIALVLMHAFTMYAGLWPMPEGIHTVQAYYWIQKISFGCLLESFTLISGYLFAQQLASRNVSFWQLMWKKAKRLLLPCWFFGIIYALLCYKNLWEEPIVLTYRIISGLGHLWYLVMLFWCFILSFCIEKIAIPKQYKIGLILLLLLLSIKKIPMQLSATMYYVFFFYMGMILCKYSQWIRNFATYKKILIGVFIYLLLLVSGTILIEQAKMGNLSLLNNQVAIAYFCLFIKLTYSIIGCVVLWLWATTYCSRHKLHPTIIKFGGLCFGVYIFQQIALDLLYYHTSLPQVVGSYYLPFIGFATALLVSILFTYLIRLTKFGKFLIG